MLQGLLDLPLDEVGVAQAVDVASWLGKPDRVISSPLLRARQTAEAFNMPYEVDPRWLELDYGSLDGIPISDVEDDVWARWRVDPTYRAGGGESMAEMSDRVISAAKEVLADANGQIVVVVSHVSPIKAAVVWALGIGAPAIWRMHLDVASITRISRRELGPPFLAGYNDTGHLTARD